MLHVSMDIREVGSDDRFDYLLALIGGFPVRIGFLRSTGDIIFEEADVIKFHGFASLEDFLGSDLGLDLINEVKKIRKGHVLLKINSL